jgi:hypothetical protein
MESLQTDVMRFMAILGLCLTAVFALVQSISVRQPGYRPEPEAVRILEEGIVTMKEEGARMQRELAGVEQELLQRRHELRQMREMSLEKRSTLTNVSSRLEKEQRKLDRVAERVKNIETKHSKTYASPAAAEEPLASVEPAPRGFGLRFASAEALDRLVEKGEVILYGMQGKHAWRLSSATHKPRFVHAAFPRKFHEMSSVTVPVGYVKAFSQVTGRRQSAPVTWGVKLPSRTEQQIALLTRRFTGGMLVIEPTGEVEMQQSGIQE